METLFSSIYNLMDKIIPFEWASMIFMKRAFLAILMIAPITSALGVPVVSFKMSFFSDTISHSAFTGFAIGVLFAINPLWAIIIFGVIVAFGITKVKHLSNLPIDSVIGVFFSCVIALGIMIITAQRDRTIQFNSFLFGDLLALTNIDLILLAGISLVVGIYLFFTSNALTLVGLDETLAQTRLVKSALYEYSFACLLAVVIALSIQTIGILLITAMLIVPPATSRNIATNMTSFFWSSIFISILCGISGLIASYYWNTATGATIVLFNAVLFFITLFLRSVLKHN